MPDSLWEELTQEARGMTPKIRQSFLESIAHAKQHTKQDEVEQMLYRGTGQDVVNLILGPVGGGWDPLRAAWEAAVLHAANKVVTVAQLAVRPRAQLPLLRVTFSGTNPTAANAIYQSGTALVREIDAGTRTGIKQYLLDSIQNGKHPRQIARQLTGYVLPDGSRGGGIVGLTARQAQAVANFRRMLESGKYNDALTRELRDKRGDRMLERLVQQNKRLTQEQIEQRVARYEANYLKYRGEMIARTEAIRAMNQGTQAAWKQLFDKGFINEQDVRKWWIPARGLKPCPICAAIPGMNPEGVIFSQPFNTPIGPVFWPFHPGCRCVVTVHPVGMGGFSRVTEPLSA